MQAVIHHVSSWTCGLCMEHTHTSTHTHTLYTHTQTNTHSHNAHTYTQHATHTHTHTGTLVWPQTTSRPGRFRREARSSGYLFVPSAQQMVLGAPSYGRGPAVVSPAAILVGRLFNFAFITFEWSSKAEFLHCNASSVVAGFSLGIHLQLL